LLPARELLVVIGDLFVELMPVEPCEATDEDVERAELMRLALAEVTDRVGPGSIASLALGPPRLRAAQGCARCSCCRYLPIHWAFSSSARRLFRTAISWPGGRPRSRKLATPLATGTGAAASSS